MSFRDADTSSESDIYFKPKEGTQKIRIVSEPQMLWKAFLAKKNDDGDRALTFLTQEGAASFIPGKDEKPAKKLHGMWIIDRATGKFLIMEAGPMIMNGIKTFANDPDYGFDSIPPYDIKLTKSGTGFDTTYEVMNSPAAPLTDLEKDMVSKLEPLIDLYLKEAKDANSYNPL